MKARNCIFALLLICMCGLAYSEDLNVRGIPPFAFDDNHITRPRFLFSSDTTILDTTTPEITILNETSVYIESVKVVATGNQYWRFAILHKSTKRNQTDSVVDGIRFNDVWDTLQGQFTLSAGVGVFASNFSDTLGYTLEYTPQHIEYYDQITIKAMRPLRADTVTMRGYSVKYKIRN